MEDDGQVLGKLIEFRKFPLASVSTRPRLRVVTLYSPTMKELLDELASKIRWYWSLLINKMHRMN